MPFRCLDAQYRRELVRVYLSNVESICRKFVEERRGVLVRLKEGPAGLAAFWQALDYKQRHLLASEHGDILLKVSGPSISWGAAGHNLACWARK